MAKRLYGYFKQDDTGKWIRQDGPALFKESAIRHYQTLLIYQGGCLKPVSK